MNNLYYDYKKQTHTRTSNKEVTYLLTSIYSTYLFLYVVTSFSYIIGVGVHIVITKAFADGNVDFT
jgi:hypothetical protein